MLMTIAEFSADFPDDAVWKGDDVEKPAGFNVMTTLYEALCGAGYRVDPPELHDWYGWWFYVHTQGRRIWVMIQIVDDCILQSEDKTPFWRKFSGKGRSAHEDLMVELESLMARDPRFGKRSWFADGNAYGAHRSEQEEDGGRVIE